MVNDTSFGKFAAGLGRGDQQAATELFGRFANRLIALAHTRLNPAMRRKVDPEDVVQSVFKSFFQKQAKGGLDFQNWESLWGFLALLTVRKCGHKIKFYRADRRNFGQEQSGVLFTEDSRRHWEVITSDPTPSQAAVLTELVESLLSSLDEREQKILILCLEGQTVEQISPQVGRSMRTVQRKLDSIRGKLERSCEEE